MSERYPRIRQYDDHGRLILREGLILCFFMRRPHSEIAHAVTRALDIYLGAVGPEKLGWYMDSQKDHDPEEYKGVEAVMRPLDDLGWAKVRAELQDPSSCILQLEEDENQVGGFHFEYYGRQHRTVDLPAWADVVSALSFWLPTEYLEEVGPSRVKDMAVKMAHALPLDSGYVSLAFNYLARFEEVIHAVHDQCFRHPGVDLHDLSEASMEIGTRVRGAYWLNFYGQPVLKQLGGMEGLRKQLDSPQVTIEKLGEEKALVALGERPESGKEKAEMRPYRALSQLLEPFVYEERPDWFGFSPGQLRRWQCRFLDD